MRSLGRSFILNPMMESVHQGMPRSRVLHWLSILGLLVLVAILGYTIMEELTYPDRIEASLHRLNCLYAQQVGTSAVRLICR